MKITVHYYDKRGRWITQIPLAATNIFELPTEILQHKPSHAVKAIIYLFFDKAQ